MKRFLFFVLLFFPDCLWSQGELKELPDCTLVETDWADGDSFQVLTGTGETLTIRLYAVDCLETNVTTDADMTRLREQRRHFGIAEESPILAIQFGNDASEEVRKVLKRPFTVFTAMADGRGDPRFSRVYAFVKTGDGKDLAEHLVSQGLARAYGVYRGTPFGQSREDYQEWLKDIELQSAKQERGVWAKTDWESLPKERRDQRRDEAEAELAKGGGKLLEGETVNVNTASRDDLMKIPGIGDKRALAIIGSRRYNKIEDLLNADGITEGLLITITPYLRFKDD